LSLADEIFYQIDNLLKLGPFDSSLFKEITVSVKTNDPAFRDSEQFLDPNGSFPFLYGGSSVIEDYTDYETPAEDFVVGTEVIVRCIFTAYNINGRTGFSFKLLEVVKTGDVFSADDGFVVMDLFIFPKRRKVDKGKDREEV
jgi:hypothetical protein